MNDGNYFVAIQLPVPWPVKNTVILIKQSDQGQEFKLHAYPDGHLSIEHKSNSNSFNHHIQPIKTTFGSWLVFEAAWNGFEVEVCVNGITLKPFSAGIETAIIEGKAVIQQPFELSIHHLKAYSNCEGWITWRRRNFFENIQTIKQGRRAKTHEEQLNELDSALQVLQDLCEQVRAGKTHMINQVAGSLRALVFWQVLKRDGALNRSYNPLLLRLASRLGLPLPVFTLPPDLKKLPESLNEAYVQFYPSLVSLTRTQSFQVVLDLQDYLLRVAITVRIPSTDNRQIYTIKEVILNCSNTLGSSHFDEDVPIALDSVKGIIVNGQNSLTTYLLQTADVVCGLGEYVINASVNKNSGGVPANFDGSVF